MVRVRFFHVIAVAALVICAIPSSSPAADPKSKPAAATTGKDKEIDELRQAVEEQSKKIDELTQQIAHLTELMEAHGISTTTAAPSPTPSPSPENAQPVISGSTQPATPDNPGTHTVTKGETLTSIAKHYKISVTELQKVNKIENDRTLQIGQVLIIPPAAPSPTPEEKKENEQ